jgi:hypothetical protein
MVFKNMKYKPDLTILLVCFYNLRRNIVYFMLVSFFPLSEERRNSGIWHPLKIQQTSIYVEKEEGWGKEQKSFKFRKAKGMVRY